MTPVGRLGKLMSIMESEARENYTVRQNCDSNGGLLPSHEYISNFGNSPRL